MTKKIREYLSTLMHENTPKEDVDLIAKAVIECDSIDASAKEQKEKMLDLQKDYINLTKKQVFKTGEEDSKDEEDLATDFESIVKEIQNKGE